MFLSASQITMYRECARKWAWKYIANVEIPQHPKAALGDEIEQQQLQPYLRDGRGFDYSKPSGYIAEAGRAFLPPPQTPGLILQKYFRLPSPTAQGRWAFHGNIDWWLPDSGVVPGFAGGVPFVGDFKTSSNIGRWRKSEKQLRRDVQCVLYAMHGMYETRKKEIDLSWLYIQTENTRKAQPTNFRATAEELLPAFLDIDKTAKEMLDVGSAPGISPLDLEPNPEMCEAYRGCPHRARCNLSPDQIIEAHAAKAKRRLPVLEESNVMSSAAEMIAKLKAKKNGATAPAPAPVESTPLPQWATAPVDPMQAKIDAANASRKFAPLPAPVTSAPPTPSIGINPPESSLPPPAPVGVAAAPAKRGRPKKEEAPATAVAVSTNDGQVSVTWGKETYQVAPYCPIEVGPFSITGKVEAHETLAQALTRLTVELATFAEVERTRKVKSAADLVGTK